MKKILKTILIATLALLAIITFASCGGAAEPADANGDWENISWAYNKDTHMLTLSGSGDMPNAASSTEVPWYSVRNAVESVRFKTDATVTSIGDYAFYGMNKLKTVDIPEGVTRVGLCSFAFSNALVEISLPDSLVTIGESAFEGCANLTTAEIPVNATKLGDRLFAFCRTLDTVTVQSVPEKIGAWTFKDCVKLETLRMDANGVEFDESAFEGAAIDKSDVKSLHTSLVSVVCKSDDGTVIKKDPSAAILEKDAKKEFTAPEISGYVAVGETVVEKIGTGEAIEIVFNYKPVSESSTEAPAATDAPTSDVEQQPEKENTPMLVFAIVVFAVVIIGIVIGAIILIRSDKKGKSRTVRKNDGGKGKKK